MQEVSCKLLVIGTGPGGYICAIRADQLGIDTIIVEAVKVGSMCLNVGCIPSKAMIHAASEYFMASEMAAGRGQLGITVSAPVIDLAKTVAWKDSIVARLNTGVAGLLKKLHVKTVIGWARFRDDKTVEVEAETGLQIICAQTIVIATGSASVELSFLLFSGPIISSIEALSLKQVPQTIVVVGSGYIGIELSTAFAKLGSKVTVVEALPCILSQYDTELTRPRRQAARRARRQGSDRSQSQGSILQGRRATGRGC